MRLRPKAHQSNPIHNQSPPQPPLPLLILISRFCISSGIKLPVQLIFMSVEWQVTLHAFAKARKTFSPVAKLASPIKAKFLLITICTLCLQTTSDPVLREFCTEPIEGAVGHSHFLSRNLVFKMKQPTRK